MCCFIFLFLFDATIILVPRTYVTVYLVFILSGFVWSFWVSNLIWSFNPFFLFVKNFIALMFFLFGLIGFEPGLLIFSLKKKKMKRFSIFCNLFFALKFFLLYSIDLMALVFLDKVYGSYVFFEGLVLVFPMIIMTMYFKGFHL